MSRCIGEHKDKERESSSAKDALCESLSGSQLGNYFCSQSDGVSGARYVITRLLISDTNLIREIVKQSPGPAPALEIATTLQLHIRASLSPVTAVTAVLTFDCRALHGALSCREYHYQYNTGRCQGCHTLTLGLHVTISQPRR